MEDRGIFLLRGGGVGEDGGREGKRKGSCSFYEVLSIT